MEVIGVGSSRDDGGGGSEGSGSLDGALIDRGKVRILLCDKDPESCQSVMNLLCKCSYQVTSVRSARQAVDALNAEGPDIDIILMEADLPTAKGMKLLKHITREENLQRIPVIMMSAVDEVSLVFKSLRLGAADFLVKPLRTNELLNLWTHMWRRRRMLGLEEKSILSSDGELIGSDLSNEDTNSTTLFSEGTDNKVGKNADPEKGSRQEHETSFAAEISSATEVTAIAFIPSETSNSIDKIANAMTSQPGDSFSAGVESSHNQSGLSFSCPKKSKLNIGNSSAFFTYIRVCSKEDQTVNLKTHERDGTLANYNCEDYPDSSSMERSQTPLDMSDHPHRQDTAEDEPSERPRGHANELQANMSGFSPHSAYPYYTPAITNQMMMPYHPQFNQPFVHYPPYMPPVMVPFPSHYPTSFCLQPGQIPQTNTLPSGVTNHHPGAAIPAYISKREAALIKFRRKRNERTFDKKIRYVNRKNLAERRPRVKGQFVSKLAGASAVDTNEFTMPPNYEEEDDDEGEEEEDSYPATQDTESGHS
ncbi:hypothetical protein QQ045_031528 [Rhodiola kirilowii]